MARGLRARCMQKSILEDAFEHVGGETQATQNYHVHESATTISITLKISPDTVHGQHVTIYSFTWYQKKPRLCAVLSQGQLRQTFSAAAVETRAITF